MLDAATAATAPLDAAFARLTQALVVPAPASVLADFSAHEAAFAGYAAVAVTWDLAYSLVDAVVRAVASKALFAATDSVSPETAYNLYLTDTGQTTLMGAAVLNPSIPLTNTVQSAQLVPSASWAPAAGQRGLGVDLVLSNVARLAILNLLVGSSGLLHLAKAHLFATNLVVGPGTLLADLAAAEANYTGYAAQTIASWLAAVVNPTGGAEVGGTALRWASTGSATANTLYGIYVTNAASNALFWAANFDTPKVLAASGEGFYDEPTLVWGT